MGFRIGGFTLLKLRPAESFSLGRSSCSWASKMSTSCSISRTEELTSPAKMGPLVCLANSLAKLAAFSPLRICGGRGETSFREDARKVSPLGTSQSKNTRWCIVLRPQRYIWTKTEMVLIWSEAGIRPDVDIIYLSDIDQTGRSHAAGPLSTR